MICNNTITSRLIILSFILSVYLPIQAQIVNDTTITLDEVSVSAIKQGINKYNNATSMTELKGKVIENLNIVSIKNVSEIAPNMYMPDYGSRITSSIYVRGLGTRIDQPVIGLNIDNIPIMDKNNYDFDIADIARIEMLRGSQSTLFGRNTMGGLINIYTLSPISYQGVRLMAEYSTGNSYKTSASIYHKFNNKFGVSITGQYSSSDGHFINQYNGKKCDKEKQGGGRFKLQWRPSRNLHIDNTFYFSILRQGGYPYESAKSGVIAYNDTCFYRRNTFNDGLTIRWINPNFTLSSITSVQHIDDNMTLDQDFLPVSYFTLTQARKQTVLTQDFVIKGSIRNSYKWLTGIFGFYKHMNMNAPVTFKDYGIEQLIEKNRNEAIPSYPISWDSESFLLSSNFKSPGNGLALYHQSTYETNNWTFTAGIRLDYEYSSLSYHSNCNTSYSTIDVANNSIYAQTPVIIDNTDKLSKSFIQILPKASIIYNLGTKNPSNLFFSISKGYKAGGFNTQMFSDVLQQEIMGTMGISANYDINEVVGYKPEQSWNVELGTHLTSNNNRLSTDISTFYIRCTDQQLTRFPDGNTTGRIMTNAGKSRSFGAEISIKYTPIDNLELNASYGYTNAKFIEYYNGKTSFAGKFIPYSPCNTAFCGANYIINTNKTWIENLTFSINAKGVGQIYWDEANDISQPFYTTIGANIRFENKNYSLDLWGQNLTDTDFKTFHFVSIGNTFFQRGKPRILGATLRIKI